MIHPALVALAVTYVVQTVRSKQWSPRGCPMPFRTDFGKFEMRPSSSRPIRRTYCAYSLFQQIHDIRRETIRIWQTAELTTKTL